MLVSQNQKVNGSLNLQGTIARYSKQRGFLIPLAAIVIVGLAFLGVALNRMSGQTHHASIQEGLSVQAFYAAESGAQYGMNQIFFNALSRTATDSNCTTLSGSNINFNVVGLDLCNATITCAISTDSGNTTSFYNVSSAASCGSGDLVAERTIVVSAFMQ